MRKLLITGLLAAVAVPVLAQTAAPVAPPAPPAPIAPVAPIARFAPMADKVVTRAEVDAKVRQHFAKLDANRDGFVTTAEIDAGKAAMTDRWQNAGIGHAMKVKRGDPNVAFDRIDSDKSGTISRDEFAKGREVRIEKRIAIGGAEAGDRSPMPMRMHRMGGKGGMGMMGGHLLKMADADKDGRVSLAEATSGAMQHFDKIDTNRDGRITPEERRAGHIIFMQMRAPAAG